MEEGLRELLSDHSGGDKVVFDTVYKKIAGKYNRSKTGTPRCDDDCDTANLYMEFLKHYDPVNRKREESRHCVPEVFRSGDTVHKSFRGASMGRLQRLALMRSTQYKIRRNVGN